MFHLCTISSVDYEKGRADVAFIENEDIVKTDIPFMADEYNMPNIGDRVVAIFEEKNGRIFKGFILGKYYCKGNYPTDGGESIYYKDFGDGAKIKYDGETMTVTAPKLTIKNSDGSKIHYDSDDMKITAPKLTVTSEGTVTITGSTINITGDSQISLTATKIKLNGEVV